MLALGVMGYGWIVLNDAEPKTVSLDLAGRGCGAMVIVVADSVGVVWVFQDDSGDVLQDLVVCVVMYMKKCDCGEDHLAGVFQQTKMKDEKKKTEDPGVVIPRKIRAERRRWWGRRR